MVYHVVGLFDENFKIEADTDFIYRCYQHRMNFVFIDNVLSNMADGGASNVIDIKKYYNEKKYYLRKNDIHGIAAVVLMSKFLVRITFKKFMPDSMSRLVRTLRK